MSKPIAIVVNDGSREAEVLAAVARNGYETVVLDAPTDHDEPLVDLTAALAPAAIAAREHHASVVYLPLRPHREDVADAVEWQQIAEDLLRNGLGLESVRVLCPLVDLSDGKLDELAAHVGAQVEPAGV